MIATGIAEAGRILRSGGITATALLEDALETASRTEAQLHAFLTIDARGAREAAARADADFADGLDLVRQISAQAGSHLSPGGLLALEIGADQGAAAAAILEQQGYGAVEVALDLGGRTRVVSGYGPL